MYSKKPKKIIIICILTIIAISIVFGLIITLNHTEPPTPPEFGFFEIGEHTVIIHLSNDYLSTHQNTTNGELLYCLNDGPNVNTCDWQTSAEFPIEYDYTYYVFIKSVTTNLISEPKTLNYPTPGYRNGRPMEI